MFSFYTHNTKYYAFHAKKRRNFFCNYTLKIVNYFDDFLLTMIFKGICFVKCHSSIYSV